MREKKKKEKRRDDNPKNLKTNPRKVNILKNQFGDIRIREQAKKMINRRIG